MNPEISELQAYIEEAEIITFFGGAGVSTESGIPDYRSKDGRYTKMKEQKDDPRKIMHRKYIEEHPEKFFRRREGAARPAPQPNAAHKTLANLEKQGKDIRVLTQNVDGLHQKAGHRFVLELHGSGRTWFCMSCEREYLPEELTRDEQNVPRCYVDNGIVRPAVTYFGETLDLQKLEKAKQVIAISDLLIIAGTSLSVFPVNSIIHQFKGDRVVIINKEPLDTGSLEVDLFIQQPVGETFSKLNF